MKSHSTFTSLRISLIAISFFTLASCKKLVEVSPPVTSITVESVFNDDVTATAVMTGLYASISQTSFNTTTGLTNISKKCGLSADEFQQWSGASPVDVAYFTNRLAAPISAGTIAAGHEVWNTCYPYIYKCNEAIEGLSKSNSLSPSVKKQLLGESKFLRAFLYFYLVNLYGDVPLALTTDYKVNSTLSRSIKTQVYQQIISDLSEAQMLLSQIFLNGQLRNYTANPERVRPTSWAATALLARVYLFNKEYDNAEREATKLITASNIFSLSSLSSVFLKASSNINEAIWQLQPVNADGSSFWNTEDARFYVLAAAPSGLNSTHNLYLSQQLLNAFEVGDNRKVFWVGTYTDASGTYYFPNKYKIATSSTSVLEYQTVLRLGEIYLIRAEARTQLNNTSGAQSDLNVIRNRAGLPNTLAADKTGLLDAILRERQVELFSEWGHRWLDLKRTGKIDEVMTIITPQKTNGGSWQSYQQWYPLPISDILTNPSLTQNSGYQ